MKWIYSMIMDGSYDRFRQLYIKCVLTDSTSFNFEGKTYVKSFAKSVVKYVDNNNLVEKYEGCAVKNYNENKKEPITY